MTHIFDNVVEKIKKHKRKLKIITAFAVVFVCLLAHSNLALVARYYDVTSPKLPKAFDGYKIVFLTDLHNNRFGPNGMQLIDMIEAENPDVVLLGGDMINGTSNDYSTFYDFAEVLGERFTVYYVYGNHEQRRMSRELWFPNYTDVMADMGITVMNDKCVRLEKDGEHIDLYGLNLSLLNYSLKDEKERVTRIPLTMEDMILKIGEADEDTFTLLLAHTPIYFDLYSEWGADLTLSGHIHGGAVRIPGIGGLVSPHYELFPYYDAGVYEKAVNTYIDGIQEINTLILSCGLGEHTGPIRLFNPGEVSCITLHCE